MKKFYHAALDIAKERKHQKIVEILTGYIPIAQLKEEIGKLKEQNHQQEQLMKEMKGEIEQLKRNFNDLMIIIKDWMQKSSQ